MSDLFLGLEVNGTSTLSRGISKSGSAVALPM